MHTRFAVPEGNWRAAFLLIPALAFTALPASARRIEKQFKVDTHPIVSIHSPSGTVIVKAWTKSEVLVIANIDSGNVDLGAVQNGDHIDIATRLLSNNVSPSELRADYQVDVPENTELQIHNDTGGVSVANVLGDMNVETVGAGSICRTSPDTLRCAPWPDRFPACVARGTFKRIPSAGT